MMKRKPLAVCATCFAGLTLVVICVDALSAPPAGYYPHCTDGVCYPNKTSFGYYQSRWRKWPFADPGSPPGGPGKRPEEIPPPKTGGQEAIRPPGAVGTLADPPPIPPPGLEEPKVPSVLDDVTPVPPADQPPPKTPEKTPGGLPTNPIPGGATPGIPPVEKPFGPPAGTPTSPIPKSIFDTPPAKTNPNPATPGGNPLLDTIKPEGVPPNNATPPFDPTTPGGSGAKPEGSSTRPQGPPLGRRTYPARRSFSPSTATFRAPSQPQRVDDAARMHAGATFQRPAASAPTGAVERSPRELVPVAHQTAPRPSRGRINPLRSPVEVEPVTGFDDQAATGQWSAVSGGMPPVRENPLRSR